MPQAIDWRRINPVNPEAEGAFNSHNRSLIVLWTPGKLPLTSTHGPGSQSNRGDVHICVAKRACLHSLPFLFISSLLFGSLLVHGSPRYWETKRGLLQHILTTLSCLNL